MTHQERLERGGQRFADDVGCSLEEGMEAIQALLDCTEAPETPENGLSGPLGQE